MCVGVYVGGGGGREGGREGGRIFSDITSINVGTSLIWPPLTKQKVS